jgi:HEAT repeat protein
MIMTQEEERLKHWLRVLNEPNAEMSKIAAQKLGELKRDEAVQDLLNALQKRTSMVAAACALALGKIGDKRALNTLCSMMQNHQDVMVQTAAAEALGEMRAKEAVPALKAIIDDYIKTFYNDRFNLTRGMRRGLFTTAISSLRQIGTPQAIKIATEAERAG